MANVKMDSMEIEERFPNFEIISEFTGLVFTMIADVNGVRYWDFIGKNYAEFLMQQKIAS